MYIENTLAICIVHRTLNNYKTLVNYYAQCNAIRSVQFEYTYVQPTLLKGFSAIIMVTFTRQHYGKV